MTDRLMDLRSLYRTSLFAILGLGVLISVAWAWAVLYPPPLRDSHLKILHVNVGTTDLCPGDILSYEYTLEVLDPGIYIFDATIWKSEPRILVSNSLPVRLVVSENGIIELNRRWEIPEFRENNLDEGIQEWTPGLYERQISITEGSTPTHPTMTMVPFRIMEDCK